MIIFNILELSWTGPTVNIWADQDCANIGFKDHHTLEECKQECLAIKHCNAFNFDIEQNKGCVLRACALPVIAPILTEEKFQGYYLSGRTKM